MSSAGYSQWDAYLRWNAALAEVVYGADAAGLPAYLDLEEDVLHRAAKRAGEPGRDRAGLVDAVRPTLGGPAGMRGIFGGHLSLLRRWHASSGDPPPVIALLSVLCLAAEDMRGGDGLAANNYYDRLMPLLDIRGEDRKKQVVTAYRKCSHELWGCLNNWLEDLQGERGLPTAYALSHEHIGRPLSQALFRATDRDKLEELFIELGLQPRARLLPMDMKPLLAEWIERSPSPASYALRAMWKRAGARERITDVACQLLSTWERTVETEKAGPAAGRPTHPRAGLRLSARLKTSLRSVLELNVLGPGEIGKETAFELLGTQDGDGSRVPLDVEAIPGTRWRLADPGQFEPKSLLSGHLQIRAITGSVLQRRPRRLVPMAKDDLIHAYVEAERLPLGESALLLCQQELAGATLRALKLVARPGFRVYQDPPLGLPTGWTLFSDVQVLGALPTMDEATGRTWSEDLNVLQPLASGQVVLEGGLRLPGRVPRWSSLAPPELRVATTDASRLEVTIEQVRALAESVEDTRHQMTGPAAVLQLAELELPDGDYELKVAAVGESESTRRTLDTARLRLRSGGVPNPVPPQQPPLTYHARNDAFAALSALRVQPTNPTQPTHRWTEAVPAQGEHPPDVPPWWECRAVGEVAGSRRGSERLVVAGASAGDCFYTGSHHMLLPPFYGKVTASSFEGYCKNCGLVKRFPAHYWAISRRPARTKGSAPRFDVSRVPCVEQGAIHPDIVFDALTHDGAGRASGLEQAALQVEPSQLFADRFLRVLESLGHLAVSRDRRTLTPVEWEVAAAALIKTADGSFVLIGRRSSRLLAALTATAENLGTQIEHTEQAGAPSRVRLRHCPDRLATTIAAQVSDAADTLVQVHHDAVSEQVAQLPPISAVTAALPTQPMVGYRRCDRWDFSLARWAPTTDASTPGTYRLFGSGITYCIRDRADLADGTMRSGDARLVKHVAALATGKPLLGYDSGTRSLYLPLGADLPGIYARAAVLCSGLQPTEDTTQRVVRYQDVPSSIAARIAALLSS